MPPLTYLGAASDHGGAIITASDSVFVNAIPAARIGDLHSCPIPEHGITPIVSGSGVSFNGQGLAYVGSTCGCGATIIEGSPDTSTG